MSYCDEGVETALLDGQCVAFRAHLPLDTVYKVSPLAPEITKTTEATDDHGSHPVIVVRWPDGSTPSPLRLVPADGEPFA